MLELTDENNKLMIVKHNDLINARFDMTLVEIRILFLALAQVDPYETELKPIKIYIKEFLDVFGLKTKKYYGRNITKYNISRRITKKLLSRVIEFPNHFKFVDQYSIFITCEYSENDTGVYISIKFNNDIRDAIIGFQSRFTKFSFRPLLKCQSAYTLRFYPLMKQYQKIGQRKMSVQELKYLFCVENKYDRYYDFKKNVILKAQKEMKKYTDIYFEFEEIKRGRTVTDLVFYIINSATGKKVKTMKRARSKDEIKKVRKSELELRIMEFGINEKQAGILVKKYSKEQILENLDIVEIKYQQGSIKNLPAYAYKAITNDYRPSDIVVSEINQELEASKKKKKKLAEELEERINVGNTLYSQFLDEIEEFVKRYDLSPKEALQFDHFISRDLINATSLSDLEKKRMFLSETKVIGDDNEDFVRFCKMHGFKAVLTPANGWAASKIEE